MESKRFLSLESAAEEAPVNLKRELLKEAGLVNGKGSGGMWK